MTPEISGLSRFRGTSHEQCGLVIQDADGSKRVVMVKNSSRNPEHYDITNETIAGVAKKLPAGSRIFAILHTHLSHHPVDPSQADWEGAENNPGWLHVIYKPSTREITWYVYEAD